MSEKKKTKLNIKKKTPSKEHVPIFLKAYIQYSKSQI